MLSRKDLRKVTALVATPVLIIFISVLAIDYLYSSRPVSSASVLNSCFKVWAHRGYFRQHDQNSLAAFSEAVRLGARGIELDLFYDGKQNSFIVSHDSPYNHKDKKQLTLEEVLRTFRKNTQYWLDFKNLESLNQESVNLSIAKMDLLSERFNVKGNLIIESKNINNLRNYTKAGYLTSYWITPGTRNNLIQNLIYLYKVKYRYINNQYTAISMDYRSYTQEVKDKLEGAPVLLFTINSLSDVKQFSDDSSVRIILSDDNLYHLKADSCKG